MASSGTVSLKDDIDRRWSVRRDLLLELRVRGAGAASRLSASDFSEFGFLGHLDTELDEGQMVDVELPRIGWVPARVAWSSGSTAGFNFTSTLSKGALSASLLQGSPPAILEHRARSSTSLSLAGEMFGEPDADERYSRPARLRLIIVLGGGAWVLLYLAYMLLG